jgi:hypothetical protein
MYCEVSSVYATIISSYLGKCNTPLPPPPHMWLIFILNMFWNYLKIMANLYFYFFFFIFFFPIFSLLHFFIFLPSSLWMQFFFANYAFISEPVKYIGSNSLTSRTSVKWIKNHPENRLAFGDMSNTHPKNPLLSNWVIHVLKPQWLYFVAPYCIQTMEVPTSQRREMGREFEMVPI